MIARIDDRAKGNTMNLYNSDFKGHWTVLNSQWESMSADKHVRIRGSNERCIARSTAQCKQKTQAYTDGEVRTWSEGGIKFIASSAMPLRAFQFYVGMLRADA